MSSKLTYFSYFWPLLLEKTIEVSALMYQYVLKQAFLHPLSPTLFLKYNGEQLVQSSEVNLPSKLTRFSRLIPGRGFTIQ